MHWKSSALALAALGTFAGAVALRLSPGGSTPEVVFDPPSRLVELLPPVPWRNPDEDLRQFFPGATRGHEVVRILSGSRPELEAKLKRPMQAHENVLPLHQIVGGGDSSPGFVVTRRTRGKHGAIELVLALDPAGVLRGIRVQAQREPPSIAGVVTNENWLSAFQGLTADRDFLLGKDLPEVPEEARPSAQAIADVARDVLVFFGARYVPDPSTRH